MKFAGEAEFPSEEITLSPEIVSEIFAWQGAKKENIHNTIPHLLHIPGLSLPESDVKLAEAYHMGVSPVTELLYRIAVSLGYRGPVDLHFLKQHFYRPEWKDAHGIYYDGHHLVINEVGTFALDASIEKTEEHEIFLGIMQNIIQEGGNMFAFQGDAFFRSGETEHTRRLEQKQQHILSEVIFPVYERYYGNIPTLTHDQKQEYLLSLTSAQILEGRVKIHNAATAQVTSYIENHTKHGQYTSLSTSLAGYLLSCGITNTGEFTYRLTPDGKIIARKLWAHHKQAPSFVHHVEAAQEDDVSYISSREHVFLLLKDQKFQETLAYIQTLNANFQKEILQNLIFLHPEKLTGIWKNTYCLLLLKNLSQHHSKLKKDTHTFQENARNIERVHHLIGQDMIAKYEYWGKHGKFDTHHISLHDLQLSSRYYAAYIRLPLLNNRIRRLTTQHANTRGSSPDTKKRRATYASKLHTLQEKKKVYCGVLIDAEREFF